MAISNDTKVTVAAHKAQLRSQWEQLGRDKAEMIAAIEVINAKRVTLKAQYDALDADIPEPEVSEEPGEI